MSKVGATSLALALGPTRHAWLITQWVSVEHNPLAGQGLILLVSAFPQVISLPNFIITPRLPLPDAKDEDKLLHREDAERVAVRKYLHLCFLILH